MLAHNNAKAGREFDDSETRHNHHHSNMVDANGWNSLLHYNVKEITKNGTTPYKYNPGKSPSKIYRQMNRPISSSMDTNSNKNG